ncbi:MAG: carbon-nitrogen hydrolase, partial [Phototrophicales bacterium]
AVDDQAKLIFVNAEWPLERIEHWRALLIARAIENQCFIVATNACGETGGTVFGGHSMIVDPWGKVVVEAGESEQLLTVDIDIDEVDVIRQRIPVFEDRRPDTY